MQRLLVEHISAREIKIQDCAAAVHETLHVSLHLGAWSVIRQFAMGGNETNRTAGNDDNDCVHNNASARTVTVGAAPGCGHVPPRRTEVLAMPAPTAPQTMRPKRALPQEG